MEHTNTKLHLIPVKHHNQRAYILPKMIVYIKGNDKSIQLFTNDPTGRQACCVYTAPHNLGYFEYLEQFGIIRVHQSFMINLFYLYHINSENDIIMHCNWKQERIPLTDTYHTQIKILTQKPEFTA